MKTVRPTATYGLRLSSAAVAGLVLLLASCGSEPTSERCLALANQYAVAFRSARTCDPTQSNSCVAQRSSVSYDSSHAVIGICRTCQQPVNAARTAALESLEREYVSLGCDAGPCPCATPDPGSPVCRADASGTGTCY